MVWTPEKNRAYQKSWYQRNKEEHLERTKTYHAAHPEVRAKANLNQKLKRYGMNREQYDALVVRQGNRCAICGVCGEEAPKGLLFIDHDHMTGAVRGLLCNNCNAALGYASDRSEVLRKAAEYLENAASNPGLRDVLAG